jgi:hypothetical protein
MLSHEDMLNLGFSLVEDPSTRTIEENIVNDLIKNEPSIDEVDAQQLRNATPGAFSVCSGSSSPSSSSVSKRRILNIPRIREDDFEFCELVDQRFSGSSAKKRRSDLDLKADAYTKSHYEMSDFKCPSTCQFECSQHITFFGQRAIFERFWGPQSDKKSTSSKVRHSKLIILFTTAYNSEEDAFKYHMKLSKTTKIRVCEYAIAHCMGIDYRTNRQWIECKRVVQKQPLDEIGGKIVEGILFFNCVFSI